MGTFLKTNSKKLMDEEIARLLETLKSLPPDGDAYAKISGQVKTLCEAREKKDSSLITNDTLIAIGANILGLLVILNFEKTGSITSKAFSFLSKK